MTAKRLLTITLSVDEDGNVYDDTQTHGNTFAEVYKGFTLVREEIQRQIDDRRKCPFNPINVRKDGAPKFGDEDVLR